MGKMYIDIPDKITKELKKDKIDMGENRIQEVVIKKLAQYYGINYKSL